MGATSPFSTLFGRKKPLFANTDAFPLTDAILEFDDSSDETATHHHPSRREMDAAGQPRDLATVRRWWIASGLIALYFVAMLVFHAMDLVQTRTVFVALARVAVFVPVFAMAFALGLHHRFKEKQLKLPIAAVAYGGLLLICYLDPIMQILMAPFAFVVVAYSMYRVSGRALIALAALLLLGYAVVIAVHYAEQSNDALLRLELAHWLSLAFALPAVILLIGKVQKLHRVLHRASRKIRNIQQDAQRDTLVGCFNRRYTVAALEEQKQLADESGIPLCLAVIDLDHFKRINDELGHLGGDEVLRTFSRVAQDNVRAGDIFGRYGGEEFLLIFPGTSLLPALNTCERIRSHVESHPWTDVLKSRVSVSIGVTQYILGESVLEFFSRADTAMYMAKEGGRNQVVVEEPVSKGDSSIAPRGTEKDFLGTPAP